MPNSRHVATNKNKASKEMLLLALTENRNHLKDLCREIIASFTTQNDNVPELFECESSLLQLETALVAWTEYKKDSLNALNPTEFKEGAQQDRLLGPIIAKAKLHLNKRISTLKELHIVPFNQGSTNHLLRQLEKVESEKEFEKLKVLVTNLTSILNTIVELEREEGKSYDSKMSKRVVMGLLSLYNLPGN
ncbi:hypothetical protein CHUAL_009538 [Chamberlinius hualienensis]